MHTYSEQDYYMYCQIPVDTVSFLVLVIADKSVTHFYRYYSIIVSI